MIETIFVKKKNNFLVGSFVPSNFIAFPSTTVSILESFLSKRKMLGEIFVLIDGWLQIFIIFVIARAKIRIYIGVDIGVWINSTASIRSKSIIPLGFNRRSSLRWKKVEGSREGPMLRHRRRYAIRHRDRPFYWDRSPSDLRQMKMEHRLLAPVVIKKTWSRKTLRRNMWQLRFLALTFP